MLFVASAYDYPILFQRLDEERIQRAEQFYISMYHAPKALPLLLHSVMALGVLGLAAKLHRWTETDMYFGLPSMVLFVGSICIYIATTWPNLGALANPNDENAMLRAVFERPTTPTEFKGLTRRDRASIVQVVSATNLIVAAMLLGVLMLQFGEWYVDKLHAAEVNRRREESIANLDRKRSEGRKNR